jgi:hypothetical protein
MYHMPLVVQWLQAGSLYAPREANWGFPGNNELIALWAVAPFSGDFLVALNNLPAVVILSLAAAELGRQLGTGPVLSLAAGVAVTAGQVVFRQLVDAENDVAVAAWFLTATCYGARYSRARGSADLALAAVAAGLTAGVKYYGLGYAAAAVTAVTLGALTGRGAGAALRAAAVLAAGLFLFCGYWYLRNAWVTGAPLYPKGLAGQSDLMAAWRPSLWNTTLLGNASGELVLLTLRAVSQWMGPCNFAALAALPAAAAWLLASGALGRDRDRGAARVTLAVAALAALAVWAVTPFAAETSHRTLNNVRHGYLTVRFGLGALSLATVALAVPLADAARGLRTLATRRGAPGPAGLAPLLAGPAAALMALAIAGTALGQFAWQMAAGYPADSLPALLVAANLFLVGALYCLGHALWPRLRTPLSLGLAAALVGGGAAGAGWLSDRWHRDFVAFYDRQLGAGTFGRLAGRDPERTSLCVLTYRYYPFFGSARQFRVSRPLWLAEYPDLVEYLRRFEVTVLLTHHADPLGNGRYAGREAWPKADPRLFRTAGENSQFRVYEINREALRQAAGLCPAPAGVAGRAQRWAWSGAGEAAAAGPSGSGPRPAASRRARMPPAASATRAARLSRTVTRLSQYVADGPAWRAVEVPRRT